MVITKSQLNDHVLLILCSNFFYFFFEDPPCQFKWVEKVYPPCMHVSNLFIIANLAAFSFKSCLKNGNIDIRYQRVSLLVKQIARKNIFCCSKYNTH